MRCRRIITSLSLGRCGRSGGTSSRPATRLRLLCTGVPDGSLGRWMSCSSADAACAAADASVPSCGPRPGLPPWLCWRRPTAAPVCRPARRPGVLLTRPGASSPCPGGDEQGVLPPLPRRSMRAKGVMSTELPNGVRPLRLGLERSEASGAALSAPLGASRNRGGGAAPCVWRRPRGRGAGATARAAVALVRQRVQAAGRVSEGEGGVSRGQFWGRNHQATEARKRTRSTVRGHQRCPASRVRRCGREDRGTGEAGKPRRQGGDREASAGPGPRVAAHLGPADLSAASGSQPCGVATLGWRFTRAAPRKAACSVAAPNAAPLSPDAAPSAAPPKRAPRRKRCCCCAEVGKPWTPEGDARFTEASRNRRPLDGVAAPPPSPGLDANSARVLRRGVSCMSAGGEGGPSRPGGGASVLPRWTRSSQTRAASSNVRCLALLLFHVA